MSKWREVRLEKLSSFKYGKMPKRDKLNNMKSKYPVFSGYGITGLYEEYMYEESKLIVVARGVGGTGDVKLSPEYSYITNLSIIADLEENLVNKLFLYYLLSIMNLRSLDTGSAQSQITINNLKKFKIKIPDLETQEKIADILSTYDELIENNNRRIEILEKTAEEIYKEWFVRMRFPGYENTKFIKGIPEGWEVKKVRDLAKFKRGKNLVIRDAIPGEVPVIAGGIQPSCYHNESNTDAPVITVSASGANAGYTQLNNVDIWASDCSYIDINDTDLIYYIYLLLKVSHKEILNLQLGSAQPHVYARDLNNFKFLKPEMKLIKRINSYAKDIFEETKYLSSINQNLIKQRDLLLPRLMNGTIEVK